MIIAGNVIAHKVLVDGVEQDDNVSCQLPSLENQTSELKGAGIMGSIDLPSTGQIGPMSFAMSSRSINKKSAELAKPGVQNIELRFVKDTLNADGQKVPEGTKVYIAGVLKKMDPGKVESSATNDSSLEFEVLRYRQVIEGVEVLLIDKRSYIYKVNGVDYMEKIRQTLG